MRVTYLPRFREAGPQRLRVRVDAADRTHDQPRRALGGGRGAARRERRCALRRGARLVVVVGRRRGRRGAGEVAGRGAARRRARGAPPLRRRLEPRSTRRQMDLKRRRGPRAIRRVGARKDESFPLRISSVDSLSLSLSPDDRRSRRARITRPPFARARSSGWSSCRRTPPTRAARVFVRASTPLCDSVARCATTPTCSGPRRTSPCRRASSPQASRCTTPASSPSTFPLVSRHSLLL